ncbi:Uma2 family endonuclease [Mariniblastus sp.]|nr:Uma2 family endonuclease [Mariniblastus sp.]
MSDAQTSIPHYSVADYELWKGDWELWDGYAIAMSPAARPDHQRVVGKLFLLITNALSADAACRHCEVFAEVDWKLSDDTVLRPDLLITCDPVPAKRIERRPEFVIEVLSPATASNDRGYKLKRYGEEMVPYYAIADPDAKTVELLTLDDAGEYQSTPANDATLTLTSGCEISLDLTRVFG